MNNELNPTPTKSKAPMLILSGIVIAAIIALAVWQLNSTEESTESNTATETETMRESEDSMMEDDSVMEEDDEMIEEEEEEEPADATAFEDGTYNATGEYSSPAGDEEVLVTIVLESDVVVSAEFEGLATHPTSKKLQDMFADGFEDEVVGKSIDEINLTVVNGSSLTPVGFMDALAEIKAEAKS